MSCNSSLVCLALKIWTAQHDVCWQQVSGEDDSDDVCQVVHTVKMLLAAHSETIIVDLRALLNAVVVCQAAASIAILAAAWYIARVDILNSDLAY